MFEIISLDKRKKKRFCLDCKVLIFNKSKNSKYCKSCASKRADARFKNYYELNKDKWRTVYNA